MSFDVRTILVALDGSPRAPGVLAAAVELAHRFQAELVLFRAVSIPIEIPHDALEVTPDRMLEILESSARADLEAKRQALPHGVRARVVVHTGVPWQAIGAAADESAADLVVIGSHGYSGIDRILGTTAARVVNHAHRPVLVVR